jgi:hypothetical protein
MRVRSTSQICDPDVAQFLLRSARKCGFKQPGAILAEIVRLLPEEGMGLFIGSQGPRVCFSVLGFLPLNPFYLAATVAFVYSEKAPRQLVADTCAALRAWFVESGQHEVLVLNLFHTDRSYKRGFSHFGHPETAGSVVRFSF